MVTPTKPDVMEESFDDVSFADMVAEVKRELSIRTHVYAQRVNNRYMTQAEADRYIHRLRAVLKALMLADEEAREFHARRVVL